jgi:hypothetical protein
MGIVRAAGLLLALGLAPASAAAQEGGPAPAPPKPAETPKDAPPKGTPTEPPEGGILPGGPPKSNPPTVPGAREEIWRPPTEEDWKRPVLLRFQRTWEDALAVARETGKPILICVNMDGEIASEHWAGVRYRMAETAAMCEPYVCVIASVYRHAPKDFDEEGRRIPCPRFGGVTCGEHIAIEPLLYAKFFDGKRISPRHLMVEPDGKEVFDVFYANDVASVGTTIVAGIAERPGGSPTVVRGDRPVVQRVASRDAKDRDAVEAAYREGEAALRRRLLEAAAADPGAAPLDLLRLAVFGVDGDLAALGRKALAKTSAPEAVELLADVLRSPLSGAERDQLLAALDRAGAASSRGRWLAVVTRGLSGGSGAIDSGAWAGASYPASPGAPRDDGGGGEVPEAAKDEPTDPAGLLDLAEAFLLRGLDARARDPAAPMLRRGAPDRVLAGLLFEDARRLARKAVEKGATGWRVDAVVAVASYGRGDLPEAYARAEAAVKALPPGEPGRVAASTLTIFGEARWMSIKAAVKAKKDWPPSWLADLNAAYAVLRRHPWGTVEQVLWHLDLLQWLGARPQAATVLEEALGRFHSSDALHARKRARALEDKGAEGLLVAYDAALASKEPVPGTAGFAARAAIEAAEAFRRGRRGGERAEAAYARALELLDRATAEEPSRKPEWDRAAALVHGGRARLHYVRNEDGKALDAVLASFARDPSAAGDRDGLGFTPAETAQVLQARLASAGKSAEAARLGKALAALDPELLRPDR